MAPHASIHVRPTRLIALVFATVMIVSAVATAERKFYADDPLARDPESQDASGAAPWDIDLFYDLAYQLFVTPRRTPANIRAQNVNTIDQVPDSSWFTNRIGTREMTVEEIVRGPAVGAAPNGSQWVVTREKSSGAAPGFTAKDGAGETWFVSFDPPSNPRGATGALNIATKIFWALGYNQVEYHLTDIRADTVSIDDTATIRRPNGDRTPFGEDDLDEVLERSARSADGSYRAAVGRLLQGKILGGFRYKDTRPDDPNDIVPHEHRRELRALRVFGAWTNLTDMKAGNTLDALVQENGRGVVKHYLQDVGSTFGMGANGPHDWDEGSEFLHDPPGTRKRLFTFGLALSPWQTADYELYPSVGRFEGDAFEPETWKPRAPTAAYFEMRDDDAFWAAQRVMAFSDEVIRAVVRTGQLGDEQAEQYLAEVLIKRRDKIGRAYLTRINPIVAPALDAQNTLTFENAAVRHGFAEAPPEYLAQWFLLDNMAGTAKPLGETKSQGARLAAPANLPAADGTYVQIDVSAAHPDYPRWKEPVRVFFRRDGASWRLVGLERLP